MHAPPPLLLRSPTSPSPRGATPPRCASIRTIPLPTDLWWTSSPLWTTCWRRGPDRCQTCSAMLCRHACAALVRHVRSDKPMLQGASARAGASATGSSLRQLVLIIADGRFHEKVCDVMRDSAPDGRQPMSARGPVPGSRCTQRWVLMHYSSDAPPMTAPRRRACGAQCARRLTDRVCSMPSLCWTTQRSRYWTCRCVTWMFFGGVLIQRSIVPAVYLLGHLLPCIAGVNPHSQAFMRLLADGALCQWQACLRPLPGLLSLPLLHCPAGHCGTAPHAG